MKKVEKQQEWRDYFMTLEMIIEDREVRAEDRGEVRGEVKTIRKFAKKNDSRRNRRNFRNLPRRSRIPTRMPQNLNKKHFTQRHKIFWVKCFSFYSIFLSISQSDLSTCQQTQFHKSLYPQPSKIEVDSSPSPHQQECQ